MVVGYVGDRIKTPIGKRKPFVIASYIIYAIGYLCFANPPVTNTSLINYWYLFSFVIVSVGSNIASNPFGAWMYELAANENDYGKYAIFI